MTSILAWSRRTNSLPGSAKVLLITALSSATSGPGQHVRVDGPAAVELLPSVRINLLHGQLHYNHDISYATGIIACIYKKLNRGWRRTKQYPNRRYCRTSVTGMSARCMTLVATEPNTSPDTAPRPCVPMKIWVQPVSPATRKMASAASPVSI